MPVDLVGLGLLLAGLVHTGELHSLPLEFYHPRKPDEGLEAVVEPSRAVESPKCGKFSIGWGVVRIAFF